MTKFYVIVVKHFPSDTVVVSGEGYKTLSDAQNFLTKERNCTLYSNEFCSEVDEYGWYGRADENKDYGYMIRDVTIK